MGLRAASKVLQLLVRRILCYTVKVFAPPDALHDLLSEGLELMLQTADLGTARLNLLCQLLILLLE